MTPRIFRPHLAALPNEQRRLWPALAPAPSLGFVLYGGTAIALQLGHRSSIDFDFFSDRPLDKSLLFSRFSFARSAQVLQDEPNTCTLLVPSAAKRPPVKISFFGGIGFGRVGVSVATKDGLVVASLLDLLATKVKVLLQRVEAKDYHDIEALIRAGVSLERGLGAARALYGKTFQPAESLKALTYFEGGDLERVSAKSRAFLRQVACAVRDIPRVKVLSKKISPAAPRRRKRQDGR